MCSAKADLAQFFTPRSVIEFALAVLSDLGANIEGLRACDPACGPGEWLAGALAAGAGEVVGVDRDAALTELWHEAGLATDPRSRMIVADGLGWNRASEEGFDLVLGNPPFGVDPADTGQAALRDISERYVLPSLGRQQSLFVHLSAAQLQRLRRFPIELLFLERFVELCASGGWVAIILPEGIFSNNRWRDVRRWLLDRTTVHVVTALPRTTFRAHATTARTCLMLLQKSPASADHEVLLGQVEDCAREGLEALREAISRGGTSSSTLDVAPPIFID